MVFPTPDGPKTMDLECPVVTAAAGGLAFSFDVGAGMVFWCVMCEILLPRPRSPDGFRVLVAVLAKQPVGVSVRAVDRFRLRGAHDVKRLI
jgi:hypothetical protein